MSHNTSGTGRRRALSSNTINIPLPTSGANRLAVDTLRSPTWKSQSNDSPVSPNQLQGIVVESMKTPINESGDDGFGGGMFQPEDSSEKRGVPWMLFRQRSRSEGEASAAIVSQTQRQSPPASNEKQTAGVSLPRSTSSKFSFGYLAKAIKLAPKGDDNVDSVILPSSLKAASCKSGNGSDQSDFDTDCNNAAHDKQHTSALRDSSNGTDGKDRYPAYNPHVQDAPQQQRNTGHGEDDTMVAQSRYRSRTSGGDSSLASLYVSTESINTATRITRDLDGNQSQHLFNPQARQIQRVQAMHSGGAMVASNPSSIHHPATVQSPAISPNSPNSIHSVSTVVSNLSTPSTIMTDSSVISSLSNGDDYASSSSTCGYSSSSPTSTESSKYTYIGDSTPPMDGYLNEKNDMCYKQQEEKQQQQQRSNKITQYIHKALLPMTSIVSQFSTYANPHLEKMRSKLTGVVKNPKKASPSPLKPSEVQLTSSLYFISGLHDLKRSKKKAGRWNKKSTGYAFEGPDSKAFFSNERTYLHWIKFGLLLGSMGSTLVNFGENAGDRGILGVSSISELIGLFLVLMTMVTLVYATAVFHLRHRWMIQLRQDVTFYDRTGPTILFVALFLAYVGNFLAALTIDKSEGGYNIYEDHSV
ncbi:hypothetical protein BGZ49_009601 [Haplosporangium sp. Z 27]|nr:hypothetical protein BGZ49_009601 [Haplosporangium sp. Z 27]